MTTLAITRWILTRTLRSPLGWALLFLGSFAWPALLQLTPIGISSGSADGAALVFEVAFLGVLLGCWRGLVALEGILPALRLVADTTRWRAQATALFVSAFGWGLLVSAWPLALGAVGEGGPARLLLGLALGAAHLAVLGLLLLNLRVPAGARSLGLLLLAWWVPAFLGTSSLAARWASATLDVAVTLRSPREGWSLAALAVRLGPILAVGLAALLVGARDSNRPPRPS